MDLINMLLLGILLLGPYPTDADSSLNCYHCTNSTHTYECSNIETCSSTYELCENYPVSSIIGRALHRRQGELGEFQCCFTDRCNQHHIKEVEGLVFRITPHVGGDVLQAWLKGTLTVSQDFCRNIHRYGCGIHYRNNVIDNWENLNITVVKYALYEKEQEVANVYFNGTGSNMTNWFSQSRIINSTWIDLKNTTTNQFGIESSPPTRRFYMSKDWTACDDRGWTMVVTGRHVCTFDNLNIPYPYILYAKGDKYVRFQDPNQTGHADVAAVFIYHN